MRLFFLVVLFLIPWAGMAQNHGAMAMEEPRVPVDISPEQQSKMGLQFSLVERKSLEPSIRTVGTITIDQRLEAHVHTRVNGWIEELLVDYVGKKIQKGQALFRLYSPDLVSTQNDYLAALRIGAAGREIAAAALQRLRYMGVPESEIQEIRRTGKIKRLITFTSPIDGYVVNKTALRGQYVTPELELYDLADLSKVWAIITLYEFDLSLVKVGDTAQVTFPYLQNRTMEGRVSYIYPEIDPQTRTARARVEIETLEQDIKPGMFANIEIKKSLGSALVIPEDSVLDTGVRKIVFVKASGVRFEPREIKVGARLDRQYVVQEGLKEGESVVSGASFLLDTESKLQAAIKRGAPTPGGHGGGGEHGK
ncbi:efflux RND transporter periplasmic adaptor subunit [bacterium]|nr:MAG: efflux RND transporter periplasmic adaptor subunit [bacterium]